MAEQIESQRCEKENYNSQKQLKSEIKTMRRKVNSEISQIQKEIVEINSKLKSLLPGSFIKSRDFGKICMFQEKNTELIEQIDDSLKRLRSVEENNEMAKEDLRSRKNTERQINHQYEENLALYEAYEQIIMDNQDTIKGLQDNIQHKNILKETEDELTEVTEEMELCGQEIKEKEISFVKCLAYINSLHDQNNQHISNYINLKSEFLQQASQFDEEGLNQSVFEFIERISNFDPSSFDKKIKDFYFDYDQKTMENIFLSFLDSLNCILNEYKTNNIFSDSFLAFMENFTAEVKNLLKLGFDLYSENIDKFKQLKEFKQEKAELQNKLVDLESIKYNLDNKVDDMNLKYTLTNPKGLEDSQINYMYLSQSLNESFFNQSNVSLTRLEMKEQVSQNKIIEAMQNFEILEQQNEELLIKLEQSEENKRTKREFIEQTELRIEDFLYNVNNLKSLIIKSIEKENEFIMNITTNKSLLRCSDEVKDNITRFCLSLKNINMNFIKRLLKAHPDKIAFLNNINQVNTKKRTFIEEHSSKSKDLEERLRFLKNKLDEINDKEINKIQEMVHEYHDRSELTLPKDQSASKIRILNKQNLNTRESPLSFNFLEKVYHTFKGQFYENHMDIYSNLEAGLIVYQKANFNKEFDLKRFLELREMKKSRINLEKQGFVKKMIVFDLFNDLIILKNLKTKKKELISLSAFNTLCPTNYSINALKLRMKDDTKNSKLMLYKQKERILMERSEFTEIMIENEDKRYCFVFDSIKNFILIALASKLSFIEKFEEN